MITLGTTAATSARKSRTQKRGIIFTVHFFLSFLLLSIKRFVPCTICFMNRQATEKIGPWPGVCQYIRVSDTLRKLSLVGLTPSLNLLVVDLWNDVFVLFWLFPLDSGSCTLLCSPVVVCSLAVFLATLTQKKEGLLRWSHAIRQNFLARRMFWVSFWKDIGVVSV